MRKSRKLMSILLVVAMLFTLVSPAMADETGYTITIKDAVAGHTYEAYQIFKGDLSGNKLSNIEWGSGVDGESLLTELKTTVEYEECTSAETVANVLKGYEDNSAGLNAFAKIVGKHLITTEAASTSEFANGKYTLAGLEAGYYLVKDADDTLAGKDDAYTKYILEVTGSQEVAPKSSKPSVVKKVDDKNDSNTTEDKVVWQDSADYDINDEVPFQLTATLANDLESYASAYKVVFHDTLSKGLTFKEITSVKIVNTDGEITLATGNYSVATSVIDDNPDTTNMKEAAKLTITIPDVKALSAKNSCQVIVEYTAVLNNQAEIGDAGNPNIVYLEYSNNPNWNGSGDNVPTGKTEKDKVIVFTYQVVVNKTDENKADLVGASFELFKKVGNAWVSKDEIDGTNLSTFTWIGLDDGDYKLVETKTPAGYNTIDPIEFTITATHDVTADEPTLLTLDGGNKFTGDVSTGALSADVENKSGATLPETGGIGTTIFYVIGGALVLGAAVLLVTRRRMAE